MKSDKTIFIIPGFKHSLKKSNYDWLIDFFQNLGFTVKRVDISWNNKVMSDYVEEFIDYYLANKSTTNYVFGFSYGAMIAFISASKLKPNKLILCSLSPYFSEDLKKLKPWWKVYIGLKRSKDFVKFRAQEIARAIHIPTVIIYGSKEAKRYPQLKLRCEETASIIPNSKLFIAEGAEHKINDPNYILTVKGSFIEKQK